MKAGGDGPGRNALRAFLDGPDLPRAEKRLRARAAARPGDAGAWRGLADVLRQRGLLEEAAGAYRRAAELDPADAGAARLAAMLRGETPPGAAPVPVRFASHAAFLPDARVEEVRAFVRARRADFAPTGVRTDADREALAYGTRRSESLLDTGTLRGWFDGLLLARVGEWVRRLGLAPFEPGIHSCKLTAYHHGHFFRLHQDTNTGPAASRRMGFLWYFDFPPRRFRGGELLLYDRDPDTLWPVPSFTNLAPETNRLLVLPADGWHEVLPVVAEGGEDADWFAARFTYSGWIHDEALLRETAPA